MGYTKIKALLAIEDQTKFMEHLKLTETSFLMQFDTKHKLGVDHLGCIAESLILIRALPQPQKNEWCTLIDARIAEFLKIQIIPNVIRPHADDPKSIQFNMCPLCRAPIRRTKSLNKYIQTNVNDIEAIKLRIHGQPTTNADVQERLHKKLKEIYHGPEAFVNDPLNLKSMYEELLTATRLVAPPIASTPNKRQVLKALPKQLLLELQNKFDLIEKLRNIGIEFEKRNSRKEFCNDHLNVFEMRLRATDAFIRQFKNCEQQRSDLSTEICFLEMMVNVIVDASWRSFHESGQGQKALNDAFEVAKKYGPATNDIKNEFQQFVTEACRHSDGNSITFQEKEMILKVMAQKKGSWYKCAKGHIYAIGDCGGAMSTSNCPDCGAIIGGENLCLAADNTVATEMDGATAPAWPQ